MVRAIADRIYEELLNAFPPDAERSAEDFSRQPMPAPVSTLLQNELRELVTRDTGRPETDWVDLDEPDVAAAWEQFRNAALKHAHIPADRWSGMLRKAVFQSAQYLTMPAIALAEFVFQDSQPSRPTAEIRRRMAFLDGYPYLQDIIEGYFDRKEVSEMSRDQFRELVERVDRKIVEQYGADEWVRLLQPLFAMCRLLPESDSRPVIPAGLLRTFFEEKQRGEVARRIAREQGRGQDFVDGTNLRRILDEATYAASPPREERPLERERTAAPREPVQPQPPRPEADRPGEPVPLWKKFAEERSQKGSGTPPAPTAPEQRPATAPRFEPSGDGDTTEHAPAWAGVRPADVRDQERPAEQPRKTHFREAAGTSKAPAGTQAQPLWMRFAKGAVPARKESQEPRRPAVGQLDRLEQLVLGRISLEQRKWYVDDLFAGSQQQYEEVLSRLERASSWAEASRLIGQEVFKKNQVNIYSEPAVSFTDAVESRFSR